MHRHLYFYSVKFMRKAFSKIPKKFYPRDRNYYKFHGKKKIYKFRKYLRQLRRIPFSILSSAAKFALPKIKLEPFKYEITSNFKNFSTLVKPYRYYPKTSRVRYWPRSNKITNRNNVSSSHWPKNTRPKNFTPSPHWPKNIWPSYPQHLYLTNATR